MNAIDAIVQRLIANNFSELAGLTLDASIPVPEALINEITQAALRGNRNISYCQISVAPENRMNVHLKTLLWPWPIDLKLRLFQRVDLAGSPKVRAFLENYRLLSMLGPLFKGLPAGITLYQDQISVDLGQFITVPEQRRVLELVKAAEIRTKPGRLILDLKVER